MNSLFVAWRPVVAQADWRPVGRLEHADGLHRFCYTQGAKREGFRTFHGMDDLQKVYESEDLFPLFSNRLLPSSRPEYAAYLRWSGFDPDNPPDPIVVLGVTEGMRQTDAIEVFPCPIPDAEGCYLNKFFLHGVHSMTSTVVDRIARLEPNESLKLMADFQNSTDLRAVAVRTEEDRMMIGYVPRYLARDVWNLMQECDVDFLQLTVASVNPDAPFQNRLLCRMKTCWPDNFRPCSGEEFNPIPRQMSDECSH